LKLRTPYGKNAWEGVSEVDYQLAAGVLAFAVAQARPMEEYDMIIPLLGVCQELIDINTPFIPLPPPIQPREITYDGFREEDLVRMTGFCLDHLVRMQTAMAVPHEFTIASAKVKCSCGL